MLFQDSLEVVVKGACAFSPLERSYHDEEPVFRYEELDEVSRSCSQIVGNHAVDDQVEVCRPRCLMEIRIHGRDRDDQAENDVDVGNPGHLVALELLHALG